VPAGLIWAIARVTSTIGRSIDRPYILHISLAFISKKVKILPSIPFKEVGMNIVVCIKQVPDTESKIVVKPDGTGIVTDGLKYVMNPYDEFAVEEGLRIKEKFGGEVVIVCLGPTQASETIRTALAMGADRGVLLTDPAFENSDSFATAKILAKGISSMPYDLILLGKQAVDYDNSQVYAILAEMLNLPQVSVIVGLEVFPEQKMAKAKRETESGLEEIIEIKLPAVIACQKGLNEPRYASLPNIMKAKRKEIKQMGLTDLSISPEDMGNQGLKVKISKFQPPPERKAGKKLEGEPDQQTKELLRLLHNEAKLI
jgi:electron transfer flavoprotein beta subunit